MTTKRYICIDCGIKDICDNEKAKKNYTCKNFKWYKIEECEPEEEQPELMTLQEALEKAKAKDKIKHFWHLITPGQAIEKKWQIIPAGPVVLTAEAFEAGEEKQWLNHKELREAVEKIYVNETLSQDDLLEFLGLLRNAFIDLKPLDIQNKP